MKTINIKTKVDFSGVDKGTTGTAEKDGSLWKITWNQNRSKLIEDWFNESEFAQYLEII